MACRCGTFTLEGRARSDAAPERALSHIVTPDHFKTMGIPLRAGRDFAALDDAVTPPRAIVNEELVRRFLQGAEPLGRCVENRNSSPRSPAGCRSGARRQAT